MQEQFTQQEQGGLSVAKVPEFAVKLCLLSLAQSVGRKVEETGVVRQSTCIA